MDEDTYHKLEQKAGLLTYYQELYQQGRPKPIDRSVLKESGAVSENLLDAVSNKLKEKGKDPEKLIQALRNREVAYFKKNKINELEQYLTEQGYLSEEEPLDREDIRIRMQARLSRTDVSPEEVERMIDQVSGSNP